MKTAEEILNEKSGDVGLIDINNALKHIWLRQWDVKSAKRVIEECMKIYASQAIEKCAEQTVDKQTRQDILYLKSELK